MKFLKNVKKYGLLMMAGMMVLSACGKTTPKTEEGTTSDAAKETEAVKTEEAKEGEEISVFIAASLSSVMEEIAANFNEIHPDIKIVFEADSSGALLQKIQEGYACDIFFSAAQKQMNALEEDALIVDGTRANVVNNQVCVVTYKGSDTSVKGLETLNQAGSIALADGSVPVGKYTRQALVNLGILGETEDVAAITTSEVSDALGGVEISEQGNVSKVRTAVMEQSCEVGTVYYSDTYGFEEELDILEKVSYDLTGNVIYPVCMVKNDEADDAQTEASKLFYEYILSDDSKAVFEAYLFDVDVER